MQEMFWLKRLATTSLVVFGASCVAAHAAGKYDGTWVGVPAIQGNSSGNCPAWKGFRLHIVDNKFNQEIGRAQIQSSISADGGFSATGSYVLQREGMQRVDIAGRITGDQLNAVYHTKYCTYNLALHRQ